MSEKKKKYLDLSMFPKRVEGKLNIYFHISENSGVGYYRQYLPATKLREKELAQVLISDFRWAEGNHVEPDIETLYAIANWADIIVVGRKDIGNFYAQWGAIRQYFNVPIVIDTDDNVREVRPTNPGYQGYHPGAEAILWNRYGMSRVFDAITVTTQDLYELHKKDNPKTFILPNNLDVIHWDSFEKKNHRDDKIRIGMLISSAHTEGVYIVKKPILEILEKYPNVEFHVTHVYHQLFNDVSENLKNRIIPTPWIKLIDWPKSVKELGFDIGLAPLADNYFNRSKSNLRWMECSLAGMAVIASPIRPYLCIEHGVTGFLAKEQSEWKDCIEKLVTDPDLRSQIAKNAHDKVAVDYDMDKNITLWDNTYREIHRKFHEFFGPKKHFMVVKDGKNKQYKQVSEPVEYK